MKIYLIYNAFEGYLGPRVPQNIRPKMLVTCVAIRACGHASCWLGVDRTVWEPH